MIFLYFKRWNSITLVLQMLWHRLFIEPNFSYNSLNPLNANFTKWSNTLKQFVSNFYTYNSRFSGKLNIEHLKTIIYKTWDIELKISKTETMRKQKQINKWQPIHYNLVYVRQKVGGGHFFFHYYCYFFITVILCIIIILDTQFFYISNVVAKALRLNLGRE